MIQPSSVAVGPHPFEGSSRLGHARAETPGLPVYLQREVTLSGRPSGFHLITDEVIAAWPDLGLIGCGLAQVFVKHTSASLTINENIAAEVLDDFSAWFDRAVPEKADYWTHVEEGPDDMPAHIKTSLLGASVTVPVRDGRLLFGRYQGIYLCEHRISWRPRTLVLTAWGERIRANSQVA
jgi:secondary thiamine-phosphate synthase enzyme